MALISCRAGSGATAFYIFSCRAGTGATAEGEGEEKKNRNTKKKCFLKLGCRAGTSASGTGSYINLFLLCRFFIFLFFIFYGRKFCMSSETRFF